MGKFNLNSLLNSASLNNTSEEAENNKPHKKGYEIVMISVYDLEPSADNFYSQEQIQELKTAIELAGEVKQNLNVIALGNGKYKVVAGHRRRLASLELVEEGKSEYQYLPCQIEKVEEDAEVQAIKEEIILIVTNSQREKTDFDKIQEVERLRAVLERYKAKEKIPGRMRNLLAEALNTSTTQIERMESISKKLTPEFKGELKKQTINISAAYELSTLPKASQHTAHQEFKENGNITSSDIKKYKPNNPKIIKEEAQKPQEQLKVYICSPYGGKEENYLRAVEHCKFVAAQGHIPFASHVMLHGIFNDEEERHKGLLAGLAMVKVVDEVWIFGEEITSGMGGEIELARDMKKKIIHMEVLIN